MHHRKSDRQRSGADRVIRRFRPALLGFALLAAMPVLAHQVEHRILRADAVVVELAYATDRPLADAEYRVYAPDPGPPFATGRTDANGTLAFLPDRPGEWRVLVSDAGGHGASLTIENDETRDVVGEGGGNGGGRVSMLIAGIGYIAGLAALLAFWSRRR